MTFISLDDIFSSSNSNWVLAVEEHTVEWQDKPPCPHATLSYIHEDNIHYDYLIPHVLICYIRTIGPSIILNNTGYCCFDCLQERIK